MTVLSCFFLTTSYAADPPDSSLRRRPRLPSGNPRDPLSRGGGPQRATFPLMGPRVPRENAPRSSSRCTHGRATTSRPGGEAKYAEWCLQNGWISCTRTSADQTERPRRSGRTSCRRTSAPRWIGRKRTHPSSRLGSTPSALRRRPRHATAAGRTPEIWAGHFLVVWHRRRRGVARRNPAAGRKNYAGHIEGAIGGAPGATTRPRRRMTMRCTAHP